MHPTLRHRLINFTQSALLLAGMAAIAWYALAAVLGDLVALLLALGLAVGLAIAPGTPKEMVLSFYRAIPLTADRFPDGLRMVEELSRRAGLARRPSLYYIPSSTPNAFALGSPQDSVICISDGLLRLLDRREFRAVLAHEVSHIANRDLWIMGLADVMSRLTSLISYVGQFLFFLNLPLMLAGAATVPWILPLLLIIAPTVSSLLQLALSRNREFDADLGAARLTTDAMALASALAKLDRRLGRFWEEILLPGRRIPAPSLLRTHPPTDQRIARLKEIAATEPGPSFPRPTATISIPVSIHRVHRRPRLHWSGTWH